MLTALFVVSFYSTAALATEDTHGIAITAEILMSEPEIGISVDTTSIDFGSLYQGTSSEAKSVNFTNIGDTSAIIDVTVEDLNGSNVFEPGIKVNGTKWENYSSELAADAQGSFNAALSVPADANIGGARGTMTVWAKSSLNIGINVDTSSIDFGSLSRGTSSEAKSVNFTNIGSSKGIIDVTVEDLNGSNVFEPGIKVNGIKWEKYSSELAADAQGSFNAVLDVPADANIGKVSGTMTVWATSSSDSENDEDDEETRDEVKFLITDPDNGTVQWINGTGDTLLEAWEDAASSNGITYAIGENSSYPGQLSTLNGLGNKGEEDNMKWWKTYVSDGSNLNTWNIDYSQTGVVLADHQASEHPYVAFVYGNWQTTPLVNPEDCPL